MKAEAKKKRDAWRDCLKAINKEMLAWKFLDSPEVHFGLLTAYDIVAKYAKQERKK